MAKLIKQLNIKGLTLVELVISIALLGIIMLSVTSLFFTQYKNTKIETSKAQLYAEVRIALNTIINDLRKNEAPNSQYDESGNLIKMVQDGKIRINAESIYSLANDRLLKGNREICTGIKSFSVKEISYDKFNVINIDIVIKDATNVNGFKVYESYRRKLGNKK